MSLLEVSIQLNAYKKLRKKKRYRYRQFVVIVTDEASHI
jgi:hypothetical protein